MYKHTRIVALLGLVGVMVLSTVLSGCGAIDAAKQVANAAKELATKAPDIVKELATQVPQGPTPGANAPTAKPGATATQAAATELEDTFNNLVKLAPVHMTSSFVSKTGEAVQSSLSYEADLDAKGNQHVILKDKGGDPTELYVVDGTMYLGTGEGDQFISMGDIGSDVGFSFLAMYGGAYLLAFNDLREATLVGTESVGGFQAKKYKINMNLASLGLGGIAAGAQGAQWQYEGYAWVEQTKGALVKALVNWSGKAAGAKETESYHSEFLASKGTVTEIKAPTNVLTMGG